MRLIDADRLKINLYHNKKVVLNDDLVKCIDDTETAYDIDKVVEELEKIRAKETCNKEKCDTKEICRICVVDDAIEIVKQGAVSDDVCEWRKHSICGFYSEHVGAVRIINIADGYKYCPYCGKKIKVVD